MPNFISNLLSTITLALIGVFKSAGQLVNLITSTIFSYIYDVGFAKTLSGEVYKKWADSQPENFKGINKILDIGIGTGTPLKNILNQIPENVEILGIDIDEHYILKAQQKFSSNKNITVKYLNFYDIDTDNKYDAILFSFSFMLMPDQIKALQLSKRLLTPNGHIYLFLTLHQKSSNFIHRAYIAIIERIKPYLKYFTTIGFGKITYDSELKTLVESQGFQVESIQRVVKAFNPFLRSQQVNIVKIRQAK